ncbi:MAG TPA: hypothetical protein VN442_20090 [Bryobacteraceae bacterium]|nr:hypothetical protein [Bryobacteraceae bacterium]
MRFTASYDLTAKIISALAFTVLAGVAIASQSAPAIALLVGNARVPLEDVREVRAATSDDLLPAAAAVVLTALLANAAGWVASWRILGRKPLEVLRDE